MKQVPIRGKEELKNEAAICRLLKEFGVMTVPDYVSAADLEIIRNEFLFGLSQPESKFIKPFPYSEGKGCLVLNDEIDREVFPATSCIFNAEWMRSLSEQYLGGRVDLNHSIYFVRDVVGSKHHANDLHFDVQRCFKFFIYLQDTTVDNGAFACVPGSLTNAADIRSRYGEKISYDNRELTRDLPFMEKDAVPVEGKAGTLIIFDTDVFHRAGSVSAGERWVMRGHTRIHTGDVQGGANSGTSFMTKLKKIFKSE